MPLAYYDIYEITRDSSELILWLQDRGKIGNFSRDCVRCFEGRITKTKPGRVAQSVTCLATDASLTADPGVESSIPARSHTFVEIDHEIISMVILLPSAESLKKGCCQLQAKVCARSTV